MSWTAKEFAALRIDTPHFGQLNGEDLYVEVNKIDKMGEPDNYEASRLILFWEDQETFLVHGDYTYPQQFSDDMPCESDHWLASVPVEYCRDVLTLEEVKARYPRIFK